MTNSMIASRSGRPAGYNMFDMLWGNWPAQRAFFTNAAFRLDVREDDEAYTVEAEMPGFQKEDIHLEFDDCRLTIGVEQEASAEDKNDQYIHRERRQASMKRSVYLADSVAEGISAKLENGVLSVVVPKDARANTAAKIEIQ